MLYEDDIVKAVCADLEQRGFTITQRLSSIQRGDDIVAVHSSGLKLRIEAKGETSTQADSSRFGNPFDRSQVLVHVSQAFYRAAAMLQQTSSDQNRLVGIALPDNANHRERIDAIEETLHRLGIVVFWVNADQGVTVSTHSPLPEKLFKSKSA